MTDHNSEVFGTIPNDAEAFGNVLHDSESLGNIRSLSERNDNHTLTVRQVARMFEDSDVTRTERSITNWCQPNKMGIARLDCYFDPNERRYFINPESVRLAIEEERAKAASGGELLSATTQKQEIPVRTKDHDSGFRKSAEDSEETNELRKEALDLKIANRAKDMFIEQLKTEMESLFGQLIQSSHKIGVLETKLLRIDAPEDEAQWTAKSNVG